ncbi:MAG: type III pantothenate kinase [Clostridia bacterium]|nr:type III pantothenate kinase [Clostridia bacterium]
MLLAVDIGNTNITLGAFEGEELAFTARIATDRTLTCDQYMVQFRSIFDLYGVQGSSFDGAIISSVVPPLTAYIHTAINRLSGIDALIVGPGVKTGLNILIDNPAQLGADLVAVSVAALAKYPLPNVVCDLGTASTITVLDGKGNMVGGVIYPGVRTSLDALVDKTSLLQLISLEAPAHVIGRNTIECMQSGVIFGAASLLDGVIARIEKELGEPVTAIATGGLSLSVIEHCERKFEYSDNLILEGLRIIYGKNR